MCFIVCTVILSLTVIGIKSQATPDYLWCGLLQNNPPNSKRSRRFECMQCTTYNPLLSSIKIKHLNICLYIQFSILNIQQGERPFKKQWSYIDCLLSPTRNGYDAWVWCSASLNWYCAHTFSWTLMYGTNPFV